MLDARCRKGAAFACRPTRDAGSRASYVLRVMEFDARREARYVASMQCARFIARRYAAPARDAYTVRRGGGITFAAAATLYLCFMI